MAHVVIKRALSRRTFLRGVGATVALPFLDAMAPALTPMARIAGGRALRSVFVFVPNGKKMDEWTPRQKGGLGDLPAALKPLAALKQSLTVISGLALDGARAHGDGPGDHARAAAAFLTCAHPFKTGGSDIRVGQSIDQFIADRIGANTKFPSLEFGMESGKNAGVCDSGYSCAYVNNVSWKTPTTPVAKETSPRQAFKRMFGDPDAVEDLAAVALRLAQRRSVLDVVLEDAKSMRGRLGAADKAKLDDYLAAVRDLEKRLDRASGEESVDAPRIDWKAAGKDPYGERVGQMFELITLALRTDQTRVVTFMLGNAGSNRSYSQLGVPEGHHDLSHHGNKADSLTKIGLINHYHVSLLAGFLQRLSDTKDAAGSLLDDSMVVYGSGIGDGNRHNHDDLPILVAGHGGGQFAGNRHLSFAKNTPLANLYLSMLGTLGIATPSFGDSTGPLFG